MGRNLAFRDRLRRVYSRGECQRHKRCLVSNQVVQMLNLLSPPPPSKGPRLSSGLTLSFLVETSNCLKQNHELLAVVSKLKRPVFLARDLSGELMAAVAGAVGKWESRAVCGISKRGGKVGFWTFPPRVFSIARRAAIFVGLMAAPCAL